MKVKNLIEVLQAFDPEMIVTFCTASGSESGLVTGVHKSFEKYVKGKPVYSVGVNLKTTHAYGEKLP